MAKKYSEEEVKAAAAVLASRGGKNGVGFAKRRSPEHYQNMKLARESKRASSQPK